MPDVDYNDILDYEKQLINKPFRSPLKDHHCYKSMEASADAPTPKVKRGRPKKNEIVKIDNDNVVNMKDYVRINNCDLGIKEYNGERVVTFKDIDAVHGRVDGNARKRFNDNKNKFIEGVDYHRVLKSEKRTLGNIEVPNRGVMIFTETGYMMLVKTFTDDLSWKVQRQLVNSYFKLKEVKNAYNTNQTVDVSSLQVPDILEMIAKEFKNQQNKIQEQDSKIVELEGKFNALKKALG